MAIWLDNFQGRAATPPWKFLMRLAPYEEVSYHDAGAFHPAAPSSILGNIFWELSWFGIHYWQHSFEQWPEAPSEPI